MLRRHVVTAVALLALLGAVSEVQAQIAVGPKLGLNFDFEELYIGIEADIPLEGVMVGDNTLAVSPYFNWYPFAGTEGTQAGDTDLNIFGFGADATLPFDMGGNATPFVKGGVGINRVSVGSFSNTDFYLNLAAGSFFGPPDSGRFKAQVGVLIGDGSAVYIEGAYHFMVG